MIQYVISKRGGSPVLVYFPFKQIRISYANSADHDQTPRSAASDLRLHCLPCRFYGTHGTILIICKALTCIFAYSHCHMFVHWHHKPEPMPLGSCRRVVLLWAWVGLELVWVVVDWLFEQVGRLLVAGLEQVLRMGIAHHKISLHHCGKIKLS